MKTELTIITPTDLQHAGGVLSQNESYLSIYRKSHAKLLAKAKQDGTKLKPETDADINKWMVSAKLALKKMEEDRKPYTAKAQEFVKLFTNVENELQKELYQEFQAIRDASVSEYAKEEQEIQRKEALELKRKQERTRLLALSDQMVREEYAAILAQERDDLLKSFSEANSSNIDDVEQELKSLEPIFHFAQWEAIQPSITSHILEKRELDNIIVNSKLGKFDKCAEHFTKTIRDYADHLLTLIPSRRDEISKGQESKKAEELKRKQEAIDAERIRVAKEKAERDEAEALKKAQLEMEIDRANRKAETPSTRSIDSYAIEVTEREGWMAIFQFYYANSPEQDLGKIKLDQMKAFAEKQAKKTGEMIEHSGLKYEIKYKAVARKEAQHA